MSSDLTAQGSGGSDSKDKIGPYTLTREIGKGSFAVVFQARLNQSEAGKAAEGKSSSSSPSPSSSSTKVAIKIVTRKKLTTKLLENLEGEISILRAARHVNIVELIDCLKTSSHIYLVMQYCRMGDLSNYIRTRRRTSGKDGQQQKKVTPVEEEAEAQYPSPHDGGLNAQVARSFLSQLAAALRFMRGKNIVHRDIKPQVRWS
jgi:serine/threonine-protein kinase ULK/ATG1